MAPDDGAAPPAKGDAAHNHRSSGHSIDAGNDRQRDWRKLWRPALQLAVMRSRERRARVLRHPDLAELLTRPEVGYKRPEQWTGYIPPLMHGTNSKDYERRNDSPRRAALVAIATEAMNRERQLPGSDD